MRHLVMILCGLLLTSISAWTANAFDVPRGAWERAIGDAPAGTQSRCPNRGIVLGGFGAGSFMYNMTGSFGPWVDKVGSYANFWLEEAAFHVYEKGGGQKMVKCLSADTVMMPARNRLQVGDGTFASTSAYESGNWSFCVFAADLDADGDLDLAVSNGGEALNGVSVLLNCEVGDCNGDGIISVGDVVYLVSYLYKNGPAPSPIDAGDANCDGIVNVGDVVYLVSYLYKNGPPPGCP